MLTRFLVTCAVTIPATIALCPAVIAWLRSQDALSVPDDRSLHSEPTPRGGGLAPALVVILVATVLVAQSNPGAPALGLLLAASGFAGLGLAEDLKGVPPSRRFVGQLMAAAVAAPLLVQSPTLAVLVTVWLVGYANAFNFMDGVNGLSALSVVAAGVPWAVAGSHAGSVELVTGSALLTGSALGFLPFNAPAARVFLGDAGSYFFGASLGGLAVVAWAEGVPPLVVLGPLVVPLADTGVTLLRRVLAGEPWHRPHRTHAYQRLVVAGWSHQRTSVLVAGLSAGCAALGFVGGPVAGAAMLAVAAAYVLVLPRLAAQGARRALRVPERTA